MSDIKASQRPWNDAGTEQDDTASKTKPLLKAVVLDFAAVSHIDTTGVQSLIDTRSEVERWADHEVEVRALPLRPPIAPRLTHLPSSSTLRASTRPGSAARSSRAASAPARRTRTCRTRSRR